MLPLKDGKSEAQFLYVVLRSATTKRWEEWGLVPRVLSSTASKRWGEWGLVPRALSSTASKGWEEGA